MMCCMWQVGIPLLPLHPLATSYLVLKTPNFPNTWSLGQNHFLSALRSVEHEEVHRTLLCGGVIDEVYVTITCGGLADS